MSKGTVKHAVRKLEQAGVEGNAGTVNPSFLNATKEGCRSRIEVLRNGGDRAGQVATIKVIPVGERDDFNTDYFPGSFAPNITQAIRWAQS